MVSRFTRILLLVTHIQAAYLNLTDQACIDSVNEDSISSLPFFVNTTENPTIPCMHSGFIRSNSKLSQT